MKCKGITLALIISIIFCMSSGCSKSCETCEGLAEVMAEIAECKEIINAPENTGENEGSLESLEAEKRLDSLLGQYVTLSKHDCSMPIEKVSNKEYNWIATDTVGTYTGEWKSFGPCGSGTYQYEENGRILEYAGDWEYGVLNGHGEYITYKKYEGRAVANYYLEYEGDFVDGRFSGEGTITEPYGLNSYFETELLMTISGTFSDSSLTGSAEYVVYDNEGNLFDFGYVDKNRIIIQSERKEQYEERVQKQTDDAINTFASEFAKIIGEAFR